MSAPLMGRTVALAAILVAAALYFVLVELHRPAVTPALDVYIYYLPNKLHAVASMWDGGKGLLWNPYQTCGEPFFANTAMGLLYPPHALFLVLEPNVAVHVVLILNLLIGATGMLLLAREIGLGWIAALGAALIFELGDPMAQLTGWSPMQNGPWAWMPFALLFCERLLRAPSLGGIVGLGLVLALELLPGWVLIAALTYQLIALRVLWELLTARERRPWRAAAAVLAGLAVAPLLVAVQLLPAAELAGTSFRVHFEVREFLKYGGLSGSAIVQGITKRTPPVPFTAALLLLAGIAPFVAVNRRLAVFYLTTGTLYAVLALEAATPMYLLFTRLPPGAATIRFAHRLLWVTGFCLTMLTALAVDAMTARVERRRSLWLGLAIAAGVAVALYVLTPGGLRWTETTVVAGVVAALLTVTLRPRLAAAGAVLVVALVTFNVLAVPLRYGGKLMPSARPLWHHEETFSALRSQLTEQDRVFLVPDTSQLLNFTFIHKVATIFRVPEIFDYEALLGVRISRYITMLWHGEVPRSYDDRNVAVVRAGFRRRLLDLASARYVVTSPGFSPADNGFEVARVSAPGELHVYQNAAALPRARYVPRIEVIREPDMLLNHLAYGADDLAAVAFVEAPPASGFTGEMGTPPEGTVHFADNDPEHLVIDVDAPARGFLILADQYYPGWEATVNGTAVPILQANYMFRLIEVPAGTSRVEFRFRPTSLAIGATVSVVAVAAVAMVLLGGRRYGAAS